MQAQDGDHKDEEDEEWDDDGGDGWDKAERKAFLDVVLPYYSDEDEEAVSAGGRTPRRASPQSFL